MILGAPSFDKKGEGEREKTGRDKNQILDSRVWSGKRQWLSGLFFLYARDEISLKGC